MPSTDGGAYGGMLSAIAASILGGGGLGGFGMMAGDPLVGLGHMPAPGGGRAGQRRPPQVGTFGALAPCGGLP